MARPNKQSVDYFPLDVHLDDKFKFIEIKYKLEGFAIIIKLLQKIYASSYWYRWTEDEALLFADEIRADFDLVTKVVNEAIDRDLFDKDLYETFSILTSKGIQKRYKEIVRKRKDVEIKEEYLLIDGTFGVNSAINSINDAPKVESSRNPDGRSTQSKVKETKVKETKEKNIKKRETKPFREYVNLTQEEYDRLIEEHGKDLTEMMLDELDNYKGANNKKYSDDNRAIRNWVIDKVLTKNKQTGYINNSKNQEWMKVLNNQPNNYKPVTPKGAPIFSEEDIEREQEQYATSGEKRAW
ncbi:DUF4373 domain-containing protein [Fictibacillus sp. 23RED33]|uniref:DUF4373 domain-containing protein n=1 Tax=Fictibacillus sp. 23RED33 TaxID=2745879 RepID=UPI0018CF6C49|nr:DUF4373 domain-containing protein [Fictibacillus sp. 23RED33]MBH0176250.1 DUF4373 domain-containing protein [Fictibacillus sp. 23RED33]